MKNLVCLIGSAVMYCGGLTIIGYDYPTAGLILMGIGLVGICRFDAGRKAKSGQSMRATQQDVIDEPKQ